MGLTTVQRYCAALPVTNRKSHGLSIGTEIGYLEWSWTA